MPQKRSTGVRIESRRVAFVRRRVERLTFGALLALLVPVPFALAVAGVPALAAALALAALGAILTSPRWLHDRSGPGVVEASPEGVVVQRQDRARRIARRDLSTGWIVPYGPTAFGVELELHGGDRVTVDVFGVDDPRAWSYVASTSSAPGGPDGREVARLANLRAACDLLEALDLDAGRRPLRIVARQYRTATLFATLALTLWAAGLEPPWSVPVALVLAVASGVWLGTTAVEVGADGVRIRRGVETRFVPVAEITRVEAKGPVLVLHLRAGKPVLLDARGANAGALLALGQRVAEAVDRREGAGAGAHAALLSRAGRSVASWREALAALVARGAGYRGSALDRDALERVLGDAGSPAEQRIGAALALLASGGEHTRERVRVAAGACAQEHLRVALDRAADGVLDEAAVGAAIEADPRSHARG